MDTYAWIATIICLTGTVVNVKRKNICFTFWAIGEIMWAMFEYRQGLGSRMVLDIVGIILAFAGIWVNIIKPRIRK